MGKANSQRPQRNSTFGHHSTFVELRPRWMRRSCSNNFIAGTHRWPMECGLSVILGAGYVFGVGDAGAIGRLGGNGALLAVAAPAIVPLRPAVSRALRYPRRKACAPE